MGAAGITLAGAAAANWRSMRRASWRSVPMTCKAAGIGDAGAEFDVGSAAGHVGGYGDRTALARAGDDLRFLLMVLGVEDGVNDALLLQHAARGVR